MKTGLKTPFRRHGNEYVLDAWIRNPNWKGEKTNELKLRCWVSPGSAADSQSVRSLKTATLFM